MLARMAPALAKSKAATSRVHDDLSEILASSQKFRIDRTNLVEHLAQLAEVGDEFGNLSWAAFGT